MTRLYLNLRCCGNNHTYATRTLCGINRSYAFDGDYVYRDNLGKSSVYRDNLGGGSFIRGGDSRRDGLDSSVSVGDGLDCVSRGDDLDSRVSRGDNHFLGSRSSRVSSDNLGGGSNTRGGDSSVSGNNHFLGSRSSHVSRRDDLGGSSRSFRDNHFTGSRSFRDNNFLGSRSYHVSSDNLGGSSRSFRDNHSLGSRSFRDNHSSGSGSYHVSSDNLGGGSNIRGGDSRGDGLDSSVSRGDDLDSRVSRGDNHFLGSRSYHVSSDNLGGGSNTSLSGGNSSRFHMSRGDKSLGSRSSHVSRGDNLGGNSRVSRDLLHGNWSRSLPTSYDSTNDYRNLSSSNSVTSGVNNVMKTYPGRRSIDSRLKRGNNKFSFQQAGNLKSLKTVSSINRFEKVSKIGAISLHRGYHSRTFSPNFQTNSSLIVTSTVRGVSFRSQGDLPSFKTLKQFRREVHSRAFELKTIAILKRSCLSSLGGKGHFISPSLKRGIFQNHHTTSITSIRHLSNMRTNLIPKSASHTNFFNSISSKIINSPFLNILRNFSEEPRINQVGIQYLSESLHRKLFPTEDPKNYLTPKNNKLIEISKNHLKASNLLGKKTLISEPIKIKNFPDLIGNSMDEHFYLIGKHYSEPYFDMAKTFLHQDSHLPNPPKDWIFKSGWVRYENGKEPESVEYPLEDELVFDIEVLFKVSQFPILATCASTKAWYGWTSPKLTGDSKIWDHLMKFNVMNKEKLIVGYNVSFDRQGIFEEYNIKQSKAFYLDAMALHVSVSGICSQQRSKWAKHKKNKSDLKTQAESIEDPIDVLTEEDLSMTELMREINSELIDDPWLSKGSPNSLANVAEFHCGIKVDKTDRDYFYGTEIDIIAENFNHLMNYCAKDVESTFAVAKKLFPEFIEKSPHPVSFAALRHLGTLFLPTTKKFDNYIKVSEAIYQKNRSEVLTNLKDSANKLIEFVTKGDELKPDFDSDPWLSQLDWTIKEKRYKKNGEPTARQTYLIGYPEWYRDLCKSKLETASEELEGREVNITLRTRITPLILRLKWEGYPVFWTKSCGWCFKVPDSESNIADLENKSYRLAKLDEVEMLENLDLLRSGTKNFVLFKVPHLDKPHLRVTSLLSKKYKNHFERGILTSELEFTDNIMKLESEASYWMGNRNRISTQHVVYSDPKNEKNQFFQNSEQSQQNSDMGIIIPRLCTMGTITRRATENTWLTASNAKKNKIGSELKSLIQAPKGYAFIGADVDSEELWIASLVGDSKFKLHGSTALGWMTLEGDKNEKTDLHSKTAEILGISRNNAKIFNYARIYGAGASYAASLLKNCNPDVTDAEAEATATELYAKTKGFKSSSKPFANPIYYGGSESVMFNALESLAYKKEPRTPVLGSAITAALTGGNLNKNTYLTSRVNWAIQSSGVDYLHLLIVSMNYLIDLYKLEDARLLITIHDELRYLVKEEDKYRAALLLQISNLWTRAMFCEQLGIREVPQSCSFFSEVDIDHVLRKEVGMDCVTISNPNPIPPGESLDIVKLLEKTEQGEILPIITETIKPVKEYEYRRPIIECLDQNLSETEKIKKAKLENSICKSEFNKNLKELFNEKTTVFDGTYDDKSVEIIEKPIFKRKRAHTQDTFEIEIGSTDDGELAKEIISKPMKRSPTRPTVVKSRVKVDGTINGKRYYTPARCRSYCSDKIRTR